MARTRVGSGPPPGLQQGPGILCPRIPGPCCEWPRPHTEGSGTHPRGPVRACGGPRPYPEVWSVYTRVRHFLMGSGPTADILEDIVFSGHVAAPEPTAWWGRALFATRLEIAAWTPRLHTVVRGTPVSGYRRWPPGPPQGRIRACRCGQSLIGDWRAASVRLMT